jgi:hypothetical protein
MQSIVGRQCQFVKAACRIDEGQYFTDTAYIAYEALCIAGLEEAAQPLMGDSLDIYGALCQRPFDISSSL